MIALSNVVKRFGQTEVLRGVSLNVHKGEVCVLAGPSGAGKSTLLRTINGLETFDDGEILVGTIRLTPKSGPGRDAALRQIRRCVGMVFQQFNLFPHLTALENIAEAPVHVLGQPVKEARELALRLLDRVGLAQLYDARPGTLSGGQQQRVAIARALAMNPEVILFDEPTSALDAEMAQEVIRVMEDLAKSGQTMIVVTHQLHLFDKIACRIHLLEHGRILLSENADDLRKPKP